MRMVVDSNQSQSPRLKKFLETSTSNRAILTDYVAMEALQGNPVRSIINAMDIVGSYPKQIIILKTTQSICQLSGRASGLQKRLIDTSQTSEFPEYIRKLKLAEKGYPPIIHEISNMAKSATSQLDRMLIDAAAVAQIFDDFSIGFSKEERRIIRSGEPFTMKMVDALIKSVIEVSGEIFRNHPQTPKSVTYEQLPNTFIFRNALCCSILALEWAAIGGAKGANSHKVRNDMIDSQFAAYATYFDGLLSNDAKALRTYRRANEILKAAFG